MAIKVTVKGFDEEGVIPREFTCEGSDDSPEVLISGLPEGASSLALIMDDPDAPSGTFTHWMLYNISPGTTVISRGSGKGGSEGWSHGKNDFGKKAYGGPCPPRGHGPHRYYFTVYALDLQSPVEEGLQRNKLDKALEGHILDKGHYMGKYERK